MDSTDELLAGYLAYTDADEIGVDRMDDGMAISPTLSFIATSTWACGAGIGASIGTLITTC